MNNLNASIQDIPTFGISKLLSQELGMGAERAF
jgi:hypothetical protein